MKLLQCLRCGVPLTCNLEQCTCDACGATWPVKNGIPRFFQMPDHYWGEVDRIQALEMIEAARRGSWVNAVRARFPENDNMRFGLLDLQRASWAPMLGLNQNSVVADIGSGYGCITHSLSRFAREVYSVEAVSERVDFTQERLRQEGISNVQLVQASATALPLLENSFDLVVVNGVLEWVGEWDLSSSPRTVQVNFLKKISRLLKENGLLLVGIENRFGMNLFMGDKDHSGIPYTSLVPRRIATSMLRHSTKKHHRTELNAERQYRTFTYSRRGYGKLLKEAGFSQVSYYWPYPGYNQPYSLVPLSMPKWVKRHFIDAIEHPSPAARRTWRRRLKRLAMPFLSPFVDDFVLLASKREIGKTELQTWIERRLLESGDAAKYLRDGRPITWRLETGPFKDKAVVQLGCHSILQEIAYLKVFTGTNRQRADFDRECANRAKVQKSLDASPGCRVRVPQSYGTLQIGSTAYYLESASNGEKISDIVRRLGYFDNAARVTEDFHLICDRIVELTPLLQRLPGVPSISPSWLQIPRELTDGQLVSTIECDRYFRPGAVEAEPTWIQHGDLSVENTHLLRSAGEFHIFDWGDLASGLPPLYDLIQFFVSVGYLTRSDETIRFRSEEERWMATFHALFFSESRFGLVAEGLISEACERLGVPSQQFPSLLLEFLIIRCSYYPCNSVQHAVHVRALQACVEALPRLQEKWGSVPVPEVSLRK